MSILTAGNANIKLEITGEDLRNFSEELISRAVNEVATAMQDNKEDCLLSKEETKKRLGVCDATCFRHFLFCDLQLSQIQVFVKKYLHNWVSCAIFAVCLYAGSPINLVQ